MRMRGECVVRRALRRRKVWLVVVGVVVVVVSAGVEGDGPTVISMKGLLGVSIERWTVGERDDGLTRGAAVVEEPSRRETGRGKRLGRSHREAVGRWGGRCLRGAWV